MPSLPFALFHSGWEKNVWLSPCLFVLTSVWTEWSIVTGHGPEAFSVSETAARFFLVEAVKLVLSLGCLLPRESALGSQWVAIHTDDEEGEFSRVLSDDHIGRHSESQAYGSRRNFSSTVSQTTHRSTIAFIVATSALFAYSKYSTLITQHLTDPFTLYLDSSVATIITLIFSYIFLLQYFSAVQWQTALLQPKEDDQRQAKRPTIPFRRVLSAVLLLGTTFYLTFTAFWGWPMVFRFPRTPETVMGALDAALADCTRKPLPSLSFWPTERTYHSFDNILLIVFFSHARYDANLDYYREVYSQFFPNIVFVGPGSREDAGFVHSYDVVVDSYQSDEELTDDPHLYKMAGRMAHHMLYTVMNDFDCYDGYLWAPFDTLLNVPRLQQFDQRYFWYHSPFAEYVHNSALGDAIANANRSRHAPPANVSPDPTIDFGSSWRGWGLDWWWGDPRVGLVVCMEAFNKVPARLRERLASYTNDTTRLIGGSADTLYIPGRHRRVFLDTLALFLATDCFLEIATPTVVHLVVPPDEPILFVDHWWIWQPPFNATFVRQKWLQGYEVDTFHTFHWGDRDEDSVWRGKPEHIADVRMLLTESAQRQGVTFDAEWSIALLLSSTILINFGVVRP
ncbi:uncharacterized protein FIBRA_03955 [Fibroporia radiculosa]|uniref:Uncharacterized protein n=1 Tax=Fibroporia radiculosa TaxID=599839 RepID=J4H2P5_9APHY|nr:uncharacterized protein FIBRA_03955 [Fibroporia radiculosa]CCM01884.1 predicted protein [Fibroporia radiculosa]